MREAQAFLKELFGKELPRGAKIQMWCKATKRTHYCASYTDAAQLVKGRPPDWYVGVSLSPRNFGVTKRCPARESAGIAGLWADIDVVGGPESKRNAAPDLGAAMALAKSVLEPTLTINSGYGLQAWWLLDDGPWVFADDAEREQASRMAQGWIATLRAKAQEQGWTIDSTQDLARLMRVPDTVNAKGGGEAPVVGWPHPVREQDGPRYSVEELAALAVEAAPKAAQRTLLSAVGDVEVSDQPRGLPLIHDAMLENSKTYAQTWRHARQDRVSAQWSLSEWDLSLASQLVEAEATDQEVADVLVAHRTKWNPGDDKSRRPDYIRRTIARAKSSQHRAVKEREADEALEELETIAEEGDADPDRTVALFNEVIDGPEIKELVQNGRDPATARFNLIMSNGEVVRLGSGGNLLRQPRFQEKFMVVTRHVIRPVKPPRWRAAIQALLNAARVEESIDDTPEGRVREMLRRYLSERMTTDVDEAARSREPFEKEGYVYVFGDSFAGFVRSALRENLANPDVKEMLRAAGFERKGVGYATNKNGDRSTASYYFAPKEVVEE